MQCIPKSGYCDFREDCTNNADERMCYDVRDEFKSENLVTPPPLLVMFDLQRLRFRYIITEEQVRRWGAGLCPQTHFACPGIHLCLPVVARCNKVYDCPGREDELGCDSYTCPGRFLAGSWCNLFSVSRSVWSRRAYQHLYVLFKSNDHRFYRLEKSPVFSMLILFCNTYFRRVEDIYVGAHRLPNRGDAW